MNKVYAILFGVGFCVGLFLTRWHYTNIIDEMERERVLAVLAAKEEQNVKVQEQAKKLAQVYDERDEASKRIDALLLDIERMRKQIHSDGFLAAGPDSRYADEGKCAQCRELLAEGTGLLVEGGRLCGQIAADKDALSSLVKHEN